MAVRLQKLLRLEPEEAPMVLALGTVLIFNSITLMISDVVAVSGFLAEVDTSRILLVWLVSMLVVLLFARAQSRVIDRFAPQTVLAAGAVIMLASYALIRGLFAVGAPPVINYALLYLLVTVQSLFFPLVFWVVANDMTNIAQAKRLFPLLTSLGVVGELIGLALAGLAPSILPRLGIVNEELLTLNAILFVGTFAVLIATVRSQHSEKHTHQTNPAESSNSDTDGMPNARRFIQQVAAFRYLAISTVCIALAMAVIEYNFLVRFETLTHSVSENFQQFYSLFWLVETIFSLLINAFVIGRIIERFAIQTTFLFTPGTLVASLLAALFVPTAGMALFGYGLSYLSGESLDESSEKMFQALVPEARRGRVSIAMSSTLPAVGRIAGVVLIAGVLAASRLSRHPMTASGIMVGLGAAIALIGMINAVLVSRSYDASLLDWRLARRERTVNLGKDDPPAG